MPVLNIKFYRNIFRWRSIPLSIYFSYFILCEKSCLMITSKSADCLPCSFIQFFIWITGFITFCLSVSVCACVQCALYIYGMHAPEPILLSEWWKKKKNLCEYCKIIINWGERNTRSTKKMWEKERKKCACNSVTQKVIMSFFSFAVVVVVAAVERHLNQFRVFNHAHTHSAHSIHIQFTAQLVFDFI